MSTKYPGRFGTLGVLCDELIAEIFVRQNKYRYENCLRIDVHEY